MKFYLIILLVFIFADLVNSQNIAKKTFYSNGKLKSEISYADSIRNGVARFYYENSNLKEERNYVNGRVDGTVKLYHKNGKVSEIFSIINGKREGSTSIFDSTGSYVGSIAYTSGKQETQKIDLTSSEKSDSSFTVKIEELKHPKSHGSGPPKLMEEQRQRARASQKTSGFSTIVTDVQLPVTDDSECVFPTKGPNFSIIVFSIGS